MNRDSGPNYPVHELSEERELNDDELKEIIFHEVVNNVLFTQFEDSMYEVDFSDEHIEEFKRVLGEKDTDTVRKALSLPFELQVPFFTKQHELISSGNGTISDTVGALITFSEKGSYDLGYHISGHPIVPTKDGQWDVRGSEKDHRDNDLMRAYYSIDYKNIYREKNGKYLYMIRVENGEDSSHKRDNDGSWGRASQLSIIAEVDIAEVDKKIERQMKNFDKKAA